MESNFHVLPPHKRFKLTQNQNTTTLSHLPAKKRKPIVLDSPSPSPPFPTNSTTSFCLPAKKRIRAFHPFDLNLEYNTTIDFNQKQLGIDEVSNASDQTEDEHDDGVVCAVCGSTDGDPTDPIVLCDGCDLMTHTSCYGYPFTEHGIPEGDWFCTKCMALRSSPKAQISCCLCPNMGGALKPVNGGKWAHLVCAIYVPEAYFEDWEGREGIDCSKVLERRWKGKCYICGMKNSGCVIDCSEPKCGLGFHVTCGMEKELCIEYRERGKGGVVAAFCRTHSDLWKKQEQTGKFKIVAREEDNK